MLLCFTFILPPVGPREVVLSSLLLYITFAHANPWQWCNMQAHVHIGGHIMAWRDVWAWSIHICHHLIQVNTTCFHKWLPHCGSMLKYLVLLECDPGHFSQHWRCSLDEVNSGEVSIVTTLRLVSYVIWKRQQKLYGCARMREGEKDVKEERVDEQWKSNKNWKSTLSATLLHANSQENLLW